MPTASRGIGRSLRLLQDSSWFHYSVDYRIGLTSVASAVPCQQPDKSEITRIGQEVATEHNISVKELRQALKPYLNKRDRP